MSDLHEEIRSAIASLADEAPEPAPFDRIAARRTPPMRLWTGPGVAFVVFAAVVVMIGAVALIRPLGGSTPPLTDLPGLEADVDGPALESVFALPAFLAEGFEPVIVRRGWLDDSMTLVFHGESDRELSIATTLWPDVPSDTTLLLNRLDAAYPTLSIVETTVRGRIAFLIDGGDPATDGWTVSVVVLEGPQLVSRVLGVGVSATDVLSVARSLAPVSADAFRRWASTAIDWHLNVGGAVADPDTFVESIESVDGVMDVRMLPGRRFGSDPSLVIQYDETEQSPTTTMPADPNAGTTTTLTELRRVQLFLTLQDPSQAEDIAAVVAQIPGTGEIVYSPAVEEAVTEAFFDAALSTARVIHDDPRVHQPAFGPEPRFDTTELGTEVPLIPATADVGLSPEELRDIDERLPGTSLESSASLRGPILHIGALEDGSRLILTFDGGSGYIERTFGADRWWSGGAGTLGSYFYGEVGSGGSSDGPTYVRIRVPFATSVVVLTTDGGVQLWQRPIAGHALIPVDSPAGQRPTGTVTALGANGETIGQWQRGG